MLKIGELVPGIGVQAGKACRIQDDQTTSRAEELVTELKAIALWDAVYKRNLFPFWYDHIAFVSRQKRHTKITSELQRMNDGNGYTSHPASSTDLSQSESEDTVRAPTKRHRTQSSHDKCRNERSGRG
jgi:hypothetical protein